MFVVAVHKIVAQYRTNATECGIIALTGDPWTDANDPRVGLMFAQKQGYVMRVSFVGVAAHASIRACSVWSIVHLVAKPPTDPNNNKKIHPRHKNGGTVCDCPTRVKWFGPYFDVIFGRRVGLSFHMIVAEVFFSTDKKNLVLARFEVMLIV